MAGGEHQEETGPASRKHRLPSLNEVLSRKTRPPVDLYMFYLFLQREGSEDILDFWLDVHQHEQYCRAYFKDVRKSGRTIKEDWPEYWDYARRRGSIYGTVVGVNGGRRNTANAGDVFGDTGAQDEKAARSPSPNPNPRVSMTPGTAIAADAPRSSTPFSLSGRTPAFLNVHGATRAPTVIPRTKPMTRQDLIESAERIYFRYLSPAGTIGSDNNHEVYLPPSLRIHSFPLSSAHEPRTQNELNLMAQIPDMFHAQKEYVFHAMEQDAFPRFLRAKAFSNLTPVSALVRLILGLVILWIGLAVGFSLIFLNVHPKSKRFFLFLPYTVAILFLISHQYELDPILILFNQSESIPFQLVSIEEPYVKKLLVGRALWVAALTAGCTVALTMIFWAVPGYRL
ncbi:regulator of G protein signaling superfamily [Laetiporus sulphureus 93-53]|uniref:Regulator of G protein signaling superfamily n=1 Tax=Laetiporus sulphureus 93-53 TaxID=1314785 RepID=A0A165EBV0_9APHY|nr:regulator of G protein signaling superfamily [Laetiporus sulphureus 93-53]KZT06687.1 regulator of G protein signaling superfamily [Laetiporus sulphureus 93-53]